MVIWVTFFIKGYIYIYIINIFVFGGLLRGYMIGWDFFCFWEFFLGFLFACLLGLWDWEFLDFVEESYI